MRPFMCIALVCLVVPGSWATQWRPVTPIHGTTSPETLVVQGKALPYYRASGLRCNVTGPGTVKVVSRWVGKRPAGKDTTYTLSITGGVRKVSKTFTSHRSPLAGVKDRKLWVSRSRVTFVRLPPRTAHLVFTASDPRVYVRVLFSPNPSPLGQLTLKTPDRYADVVRLERKEVEVKYYRATYDTPVELEVVGPTSLVMFSRLEFTYDMKGLQNYQVQVIENAQVIHSFTWTTTRSDVTRHLDRDDLVPSPGRRCVIQVPPGVHRYSFKPASPSESILLRFFIPVKDL